VERTSSSIYKKKRETVVISRGSESSKCRKILIN